jgi:hypothetical protein
MTPEEQQLAIKENLKAQIDRMLITDVEFNDFNEDNQAQTVTFKGFWNPLYEQDEL